MLYDPGSVRELMARKNLSINRLSEVTGMDRETISRAMRHGANPTIRTLFALSHALNVDISELFTRRHDATIHTNHG